MIVHKRLQNDYDEGGIEIQINFNVDNGVVTVSSIQIHSSFDSGLPTSPAFEEFNNKDFLVAHYTTADKNVFERIIGNIYADKITKQIRELINNLPTDDGTI